MAPAVAARSLRMAVRLPLSSLAARILKGQAYTDEDVRKLAASVLGQDETQGQGSHIEVTGSGPNGKKLRPNR